MEQEQPQAEVYEHTRLRIFKIKQAELGARAPAHVEHKRIYEYEFICDINGPSPERSSDFAHFSSYFKIQFRGENLLKGIVPNSLRVIDPVIGEHYVVVQANLVDSQLLITADFDLSEPAPNVSQVQIHFKIVLLDKLDLNLMRLQKAQVMQQAHCFEIYHRNGTPPTVNYATHGTNPYEEEDEDDLEGFKNFKINSQINNIVPLVPPQIGGSSLNPDEPNTMDDLQHHFQQMDLLEGLTSDVSTKPRPAYVNDNVMIRFEISKLPSITVACAPATNVGDLLEKLKNIVFEERLHFPEIAITNDMCETLRIQHDNLHLSNTTQTIGDVLHGKDVNKIQFMVLVWGDPLLNAQITPEDAQFDE